MIEAFYSGVAGLTAHQNSLDVVSNNIANANTNGYKTKRQDFSSLLSVSEVRPETENSQNLLAGAGSAVNSVTTDMSNGTVKQTGNLTDYYINGDGFFAVADNDGNRYYTRDGSFQMLREGNGYILGTSNGMRVLDANGNTIRVTANGAAVDPGVYTFRNAPGLLSAGENLFTATNVSGPAVVSNTVPEKGKVEISNVDISEQMVGLITSQRGYQLNSSVVSTADQIENMINDLAQ